MGTKTEAKDYTYEIKISSDDQVKNTLKKKIEGNTSQNQLE